jgi:hypothetical protein
MANRTPDDALAAAARNGALLKEDPATANFQSGSPIIRAETQ